MPVFTRPVVGQRQLNSSFLALLFPQSIVHPHHSYPELVEAPHLPLPFGSCTPLRSSGPICPASGADRLPFAGPFLALFSFWIDTFAHELFLSFGSLQSQEENNSFRLCQHVYRLNRLN
jgi:hypothetical protein